MQTLTGRGWGRNVRIMRGDSPGPGPPDPMRGAFNCNLIISVRRGGEGEGLG